MPQKTTKTTRAMHCRITTQHSCDNMNNINNNNNNINKNNIVERGTMYCIRNNNNNISNNNSRNYNSCTWKIQNKTNKSKNKNSNNNTNKNKKNNKNNNNGTCEISSSRTTATSTGTTKTLTLNTVNIIIEKTNNISNGMPTKTTTTTTTTTSTSLLLLQDKPKQQQQQRRQQQQENQQNPSQQQTQICRAQKRERCKRKFYNNNNNNNTCNTSPVQQQQQQQQPEQQHHITSSSAHFLSCHRQQLHRHACLSLPAPASATAPAIAHTIIVTSGSRCSSATTTMALVVFGILTLMLGIFHSAAMQTTGTIALPQQQLLHFNNSNDNHFSNNNNNIMHNNTNNNDSRNAHNINSNDTVDIQHEQQQQQESNEQQLSAAAATATLNHTLRSLSFIDGAAYATSAEMELTQLHDVSAQQPIFDFGMPRNITGRTGQTEAIIKCRVDRLHDKSVSWIRKRDLHILTVGTATYTSDKRFEVTTTKDLREWTLHVKAPQPRDSGIYECQVNTEPKISMAFQMNIIEISPDARAVISGPHDLHFKVGSAIVLNCIVEQPSVKDIGPIYWYRGEHIITPFDVDDVDAKTNPNANSNVLSVDVTTARAPSQSSQSKMTHRIAAGGDDYEKDLLTLGNSIATDVGNNEYGLTATHDITQDFTARIAMESQLGDTLKSRLRISNAQTTDTGNYTCQPTTASSASVMVHVINDENPAAMQKSKAGSLHATLPLSMSFLACLLVFIVAHCRRIITTTTTAAADSKCVAAVNDKFLLNTIGISVNLPIAMRSACDGGFEFFSLFFVSLFLLFSLLPLPLPLSLLVLQHTTHVLAAVTVFCCCCSGFTNVIQRVVIVVVVVAAAVAVVSHTSGWLLTLLLLCCFCVLVFVVALKKRTLLSSLSSTTSPCTSPLLTLALPQVNANDSCS